MGDSSLDNSIEKTTPVAFGACRIELQGIYFKINIGWEGLRVLLDLFQHMVIIEVSKPGNIDQTVYFIARLELCHMSMQNLGKKP